MNFSAIHSQSAIGKILRAPLKLIPRQATLPILQGRARGKKWVAGSHDHGCWLGSYEYKKRKLFESLIQTGDCVYDIGAHVGYYSLIASCIVGDRGSVYAFEPFLKNIEALKKHIALNALSNVTVIPSAVADKEGFGLFSCGGSSAVGQLTDTGSVSVSLVSLDDFSRNARPPTHLKIDVEGAEFLVLNGAQSVLKQCAPIIFLATHSDKLRSDCRSFLQNIGYSVDSITDDEFLARK